MLVNSLLGGMVYRQQRIAAERPIEPARLAIWKA